MHNYTQSQLLTIKLEYVKMKSYNKAGLKADLSATCEK